MGLFRDNEAAASELIMHLAEYPAVGQWIPGLRVPWRWNFMELFSADEFRTAVQQHSFWWLLGCHWPFNYRIHVVSFRFSD
jgi:hypothetical protein